MIFLSFDHAINKKHDDSLKILARNRQVTRSKKSYTRQPPPTASGQLLVQVHISTSSQVQDIWQNGKRLGMFIAEAM